jgi:2-amino-4-hydroxy-6-hydroxymethyldihydropteridine diphosphokinase
MSTAFTAFIGLGANLGDVEASLRSALGALRQMPQSALTGVSRLYRSAPLGPAGQPDYLNAAVRLETRLTPHALLHALQGIENSHGRVRGVRWGARTLDLDLLLYGNDIVSTSDLIVPHIELKNRNFVVIPLLDIDAGLMLPDGSPLATLPVAQDGRGLQPLHDNRHWAD